VGEFAGGFGGAALGIAEVVEADDQLLLAERLSLTKDDGSRIHARQRALALTVDTGIDEPGERDVVIGQRAAGEDRDRRGHEERITGPLRPATDSDAGFQIVITQCCPWSSGSSSLNLSTNPAPYLFRK